MAKLVSKTYGDALFAIALEESRVDEFFESAKVVREVWDKNEEFRDVLNHPEIEKESKLKMLEEVFDNNIPKEMVGLMILIVSKGRAKEISAVFEYFIGLIKEEKKIAKVDVTTAVALNDGQKKQLVTRLEETTKYESFEMNYQVDAALIGGMVIRIGDRVVDSSIKTKLYEMSRELRNIQV